MDYPPHDELVHPTLYPGKQAALESKEASETIEWEQILRHLPSLDKEGISCSQKPI